MRRAKKKILKEAYMSKFFSIIIFTLMISLLIGGCATSRIVPEPGKITLQEAMTEVAIGLNNMYDAGKNYPKVGLVPSEVTVVFNISADAKDTGKLYIEAGATVADVVEIAKVGAEKGSEINVKRGNQVTIKFTNILSDFKGSLIMTKKPDDIKELLKALEDAGYTPIVRK